MSILYRITAGILLFFAVFVAPWWVVGIIAVIGAIRFGSYYELVIAAFVMDVLYSKSSGLFWGTPFLFTVVGVLIFLGAEFVRVRVRFLRNI